MNANTNTNIDINTNIDNRILETGSLSDQIFKQYEGKDPEAIIQEVGGTDRGCINRTIYHFNSLGLTKGQISRLIGKRFQHVRNVLHNQKLAKAKAAANTATLTTAAPGHAPNFDQNPKGMDSAQPAGQQEKKQQEEPKEVVVEPKIEKITTKSGISLAKTGFKEKSK